MSNLVATHAQKASEAEQGNHIIFFSPSLKPCPSIYESVLPYILTLLANFSIFIIKRHGSQILNETTSQPRIEEKDRQTQLLCYVSLIRACNKVL